MIHSTAIFGLGVLTGALIPFWPVVVIAITMVPAAAVFLVLLVARTTWRFVTAPFRGGRP